METITINDRKYLSIDDYAKYKNVTRKTVYNMIEDGRIKKEQIKKILNRQFIEIR